jgi:HD-GYP domain-containing protein (c-di-GMP phosphodiesterase class II)/CHASE2 domain-containing sensor protein
MGARTRDVARALGLGAAVAVAAGLAIGTGVLAPLQRLAGDALLRLVAGRPLASPPGLPDVALVALDPPSLRAFPAWPWPRGLHADAIARLDAAGAKAIAIDIDFSTPRDAADDARLAQAVAASGRVVLATFRQRTPLPGGGEIEVANVPYAALERAAAGVGSVLIPVDADGVVRHAPRASEIGGRAIPCLGAAALAVALGETPRAGEQAGFLLDYRRIAPFPVIPIADVLAGRFDPRDVAGRVVFVGATAAEFQDLWSTPLGPAKPGVVIQALAYRTLAAERSSEAVLTSPGPATAIGVAALLSIALALLGLAPPAARTLALAGGACGVVGGAWLAAARAGLALDPVAPLGVLVLHYVIGLEGLWRRFGRRLEAREHSLATLFDVSELAVRRDGPEGGLELALALLGDVIDAAAVALLRATSPAAGEPPALDGTRLEWRRPGSRADAPVGDPVLATTVLGERRLRVSEGRIPGPSPRPGLAAYVPLAGRDGAIGVLVIERDDPTPLDTVQLRTIAAVGMQLALSSENLRLLEGLRATFDASVAAIATAIEARDGYTEAHCRRLAALSAILAERFGLPPEEIEAIRLGALLHDVGKIGIRDHVLLKPTRFTAEERRDMERHPDIGHRIIARIDGFRATTLHCVRHHHERWDGRGYPDRLAASEIPLGARIVAVVDVWDALSTKRPYKAALPAHEVRAYLEKEKGIQFDPGVVDQFLQLLDEEWPELESLLGQLPEKPA